MEANMLVVVVDALRADRVGALGGREITPRIDEFAEEATVFTNAFSTTNATDSAVTSIQTGRHPRSHGILNHGRRVTNKEKRAVESVSQLPKVLANEGYSVGKFGRPLGRWHRKGFDIYPDSMESRIPFDHPDRGTSTVERIESISESLLKSIHPSLRDFVGKRYISLQDTLSSLYSKMSRRMQSPQRKNLDDEDEVVENLADFVDANGDFFGFVHLMDTHTLDTADIDLVAEYLDRFDYYGERVSDIGHEVPERFHEAVLGGEYPSIKEEHYFPWTDKPSTAIIDAHYDVAAHEADRRFGRMIDEIEARGELDDTLVVLVADHGESLTEHGIYYDHHGLYDVSTRVPLIVRPPGGSSGRVEDLVQVTDIAPTVASYTDASDLSPDGQSLRDVIQNGATVDRDYVFAEEAHTQKRRMIRTDDEKLIYSLDGDTVCRYCGIEHASEVEFYDLSKDPHERCNIADDRPNRVEELRKRAESWADSMEARRGEVNREGVEYDDEEEVYKRLDALGYR